MNYKHYTYNINPSNVIVIGDLHGEFSLLYYKIKSLEIENSIIIVAGDCGFGFEKKQYYIDVYNSFKKYLIEKNVTVLFIRGNHDDPDYFNNEIINFEHWITIPDYSVISLLYDNKTYNILCVGGAISVDRIYRIPNDDESNVKYRKYKKTYWDNEKPIYNPDIIDEITQDGIVIDTVITHTSPNFAPLHTKNGLSGYLILDPLFFDDLENERETITKIYNHLINSNKHNVKLWIYGHFHKHDNYMCENGVNFKLLDMVSTRNNSWDSFSLKING